MRESPSQNNDRGFEVSVCIPLQARRPLGWNLHQGAERPVAAGLAKAEMTAGDVKLN
jgi:hypothetical protein